MARRRKMDNLERDSAEALRPGYGVHYGRYKADHPHTREGTEPSESVTLPNDTIPCRYCGKLFAAEESGYTKNARFCSEDCRMESTRLRQRGYYLARKMRGDAT